MNSVIVEDFISNLNASEFESWILVQREYKDRAWGEEIFQIGYSLSSRYLYIFLRNGVQICSRDGGKIEYCVFNYHAGEEFFFDTYEDALIYAQTEA